MNRSPTFAKGGINENVVQEDHNLGQDTHLQSRVSKKGFASAQYVLTFGALFLLFSSPLFSSLRGETNISFICLDQWSTVFIVLSCRFCSCKWMPGKKPVSDNVLRSVL